jgi:anaerobic magnesium-protoporphyrin IX monomethyl ester cyclase
MKIMLIRVHVHTLQLIPPLGLGYISSSLDKHGIENQIIDGLRDNLTNENILEVIKKEKPEAVGISCMTAEYNVVADLSNIIKNSGLKVKVIIGGVHATIFPYQTLVDSQADFVICGEGEKAFVQLAMNNFDNEGIKGVYSLADLKENSDNIQFAEYEENLDNLPFPTWEKIRPETYRQRPAGLIYKKMPIGYVMTSRGCVCACTFCANPFLSNKRVRFRSIENVIAEIKLLIEKYGIKEIKFIDDNLAFKKEHIMSLCRAIIDNNLKIAWGCTSGLRAANLDEEIVSAMKKAGCYNFNIGIESADKNILAVVKKQETPEQFTRAINLAHKYNIVCGGFFIFGLPGETKETMQKSIDFAVKSELALATFNVLDILPGSQMWKDLNYKFNRNEIENSYSQPREIYENITGKDIIEMQRKALRMFYFRPKIFFRLLKFIKKEPVFYFLERLFKRVET